jgi:hypothetical protein
VTLVTKLNTADCLVLVNIALASLIGQHFFAPDSTAFKLLVMAVAVTHAAGNMLSKSAAAAIAADQDDGPAGQVVPPKVPPTAPVTAPEVKP